MICVIDESFPHNWAASDFSEHWLSIISSIWNNYMEHINKGPGWESGLGAIITWNSKANGEVCDRVGRELTRRNVNSAGGWVSVLSVVLRKSGQELLDPRYEAYIMWKWDLCSSLSTHLLPLCSSSAWKTSLWLLLAFLTYCLSCCWSCRWCTDDLQTKLYSLGSLFESFFSLSHAECGTAMGT